VHLRALAERSGWLHTAGFLALLRHESLLYVLHIKLKRALILWFKIKARFK
jgi:hypothetical protein